MNESDQRRFLRKFLVGDGCFEWQSAISGGGYGYFRLKGRSVVAHRLSYELFVGAIPEGLQIDHLCRNTRCVRPDHLEPVTPRENVQRGARLITHCPHGHAYDEANTSVRRGARECRQCKRDYMRDYKRRNRSAWSGDPYC